MSSEQDASDSAVHLAEKEKTVGVLGGMGPWATWAFCRTLTQLTPARKDWEHLRVLVDCNVKIPSRTRAVLYDEASPVPGMVKGIQALAQAGADLVAVPCNSAHFFYESVTEHIDIPWPHMIQITAKAAKERMQRPFILGGYITVQKRTYSPYLEDAVYPQRDDAKLVTDIIEQLKLRGIATRQLRDDFKKLILGSRLSQGIDGLILGCTEFALLVKEDQFCGLPVIDSSLEYGRYIVKKAKGNG